MGGKLVAQHREAYGLGDRPFEALWRMLLGLRVRVSSDPVLANLLTISLVGLFSGALIQVLLATTLPAPARGVLALILESALLMAVIFRKGQDDPLLAIPEGFPRKKFLFALFPLREFAPVLGLILAAGLVAITLGGTFIGVVLVLAVGFVVFDFVAYAARVHAYGGVPTYFWLVFGFSQIVLIAFGIAMALTNSGTVLTWWFAYAAPGILLGPILLLAARRGRWADRWVEAQGLLIQLKKAGLTLLPGVLASVLSLRIERFVLPALFGFGPLGAFVIVAGLLDLVYTPVRVWISSSLSKWSVGAQGISRPETLRKFFILLLVSVPLITFLAFASWLFVEWFLDETYSSAAVIILPLSLSSLSHVVYLFARGLLMARGFYKAIRNLDVLFLALLVLAYAAIGLTLGFEEFVWSRMVVFSIMPVLAFWKLLSLR